MKMFGRGLMIAALLLAGITGVSASTTDECASGFLSDPCPIDGYSTVETEKMPRHSHSWMKSAHSFDFDVIVDDGKRSRSVRHCCPTRHVATRTYHRVRRSDGRRVVVKSDCRTAEECSR